MIKFKSFSSGSCGNCYFFGIADERGYCSDAILVDAGVSVRRLKTFLLSEGIQTDVIRALLVTHDHWDHIRSLGSFCKRLCVPVFAPGALQSALLHHPGTGEYLKGVQRPLEDGWNDVLPGLVRVRAFEVPHDASVTFGYELELSDGGGVTRCAVITDCGRVLPDAQEVMTDVDALILESNYDPEMLRLGPYPPDLQARIRGGCGHLSNIECAEALRSLGSPKRLRSVFLCHLSEHNNTPELALEASRKALPSGVRLVALPRETASPMFQL